MQRWSQGQKARGQGQAHKKSDAKAKNSLYEDRPSRGQGQECSKSRPRIKDTGAGVLRKKKGLETNLSGELQKKVLANSKKFWRTLKLLGKLQNTGYPPEENVSGYWLAEA